jgi:hypothetical protein
MSQTESVLPRWILDKCIDCAYAAYAKEGINCEHRIGVMLECEWYTLDKQRVEIIERTKEILRNPK